VSLLGVFFIVYFALWKGIKSSGKVRSPVVCSSYLSSLSCYVGGLDYGDRSICRAVHSLDSWRYSEGFIHWHAILLAAEDGTTEELFGKTSFSNIGVSRFFSGL
jgi:hypothetical protein